MAVRVAVRVRPNDDARLLSAGAGAASRGAPSLHVEANTVTVSRPMASAKPNAFTFDVVLDGRVPPEEGAPSPQSEVFGRLGAPILDKVVGGYNVTLFAYGQTGAGKSFTMMGEGHHPGLIPRVCRALFSRLEDLTVADTTVFRVEASYLELFNEQVFDLLTLAEPTVRGRAALRVREHPERGPMVEGLSTHAVSDFRDVFRLITAGNMARTVASTNFNVRSSRSHTIFTLSVTKTTVRHETAEAVDTVSKLHLVDLAGSERAGKAGATGDRMVESQHINKSLTSLGMVIAAVAETSKPAHVPYRNSLLTWLLKDSLGGNAFTTMIACVQSSPVHLHETLSTLRWADRAKRIRNTPKINADPNRLLISSLKAQIADLRRQLALQATKGAPPPGELVETVAALRIQNAFRGQLMKRLRVEWERRVQATHDRLDARANTKAVGTPTAPDDACDAPFLINLHTDPQLSGQLRYNLRHGNVTIGSDAVNAIRLLGVSMLPLHCTLECEYEPPGDDDDDDDDWGGGGGWLVTLHPSPGADVWVNGVDVGRAVPKGTPTVLGHGSRIVLGGQHFFVFQEEEGGEAVSSWEDASRELLVSHPLLSADAMQAVSPAATPSPQRSVLKGAGVADWHQDDSSSSSARSSPLSASDSDSSSFEGSPVASRRHVVRGSGVPEAATPTARRLRMEARSATRPESLAVPAPSTPFSSASEDREPAEVEADAAGASEMAAAIARLTEEMATAQREREEAESALVHQEAVAAAAATETARAMQARALHAAAAEWESEAALQRLGDQLRACLPLIAEANAMAVACARPIRLAPAIVPSVGLVFAPAAPVAVDVARLLSPHHLEVGCVARNRRTGTPHTWSHNDLVDRVDSMRLYYQARMRGTPPPHHERAADPWYTPPRFQVQGRCVVPLGGPAPTPVAVVPLGRASSVTSVTFASTSVGEFAPVGVEVVPPAPDVAVACVWVCPDTGACAHAVTAPGGQAFGGVERGVAPPEGPPVAVAAVDALVYFMCGDEWVTFGAVPPPAAGLASPESFRAHLMASTSVLAPSPGGAGGAGFGGSPGGVHPPSALAELFDEYSFSIACGLETWSNTSLAYDVSYIKHDDSLGEAVRLVCPSPRRRLLVSVHQADTRSFSVESVAGVRVVQVTPQAEVTVVDNPTVAEGAVTAAAAAVAATDLTPGDVRRDVARRCLSFTADWRDGNPALLAPCAKGQRVRVSLALDMYLRGHAGVATIPLTLWVKVVKPSRVFAAKREFLHGTDATAAMRLCRLAQRVRLRVYRSPADVDASVSAVLAEAKALATCGDGAPVHGDVLPPETMMLSTVASCEHAGYVRRKGRLRSPSRWMVVARPLVALYSNMEALARGSRPTDVAFLVDCRVVPEPGDALGFSVNVKDGTTWMLQAPSQSDRRVWLRLLRSRGGGSGK